MTQDIKRQRKSGDKTMQRAAAVIDAIAPAYSSREQARRLTKLKESPMTDLRALLTRAGEVLELALKTPRNAWEFQDAGLVYTREVMLRVLHTEITAALAAGAEVTHPDGPPPPAERKE